ncbi:hypothetical protein [Bacillus arachidis]|uniref:Uncharacterized protein n=1 Tax=Bacillus arachidis TaxID=2819290 RepID=A0ABS3P2M0_9BACI|nr:hypothetical protein [Bacillus arachidis]MBO1627446.1 hypothetical protein [Bacillus arachidis]
MFKINFKVFSETSSEEELNGEEGYFQIVIEEEEYGLFLPEEIDEFAVSIYWWFYYFLEALIILKNDNYVLISDIEKAETWLELRKEENNIYISKVKANKIESGGPVITNKLPDLTYPYWQNKKVNFILFENEMLNKSRIYIQKLKEINKSNNKDIIKLEELFNKADTQ